MPEPEPPASSNLKLKLVTALAVGLLLYIGICGVSLMRGPNGLPHGLIFWTTGIFMLIVVAVWLALRAILRKDRP